MTFRVALLAVTATVACSGASFAQSDAMQMARSMSANQLGLLEYCQGHGWTDQAAVDAENANISKLPPATDQVAIGKAEAAGKNGMFVTNDTQRSLSEMASSKNSTEQSVCGQMGDAVKSVAAQMASVPGGMPTMPNGGAMPGMPNGVTMPTMPSMPNMPNMPNMPTMPAPPK